MRNDKDDALNNLGNYSLAMPYFDDIALSIDPNIELLEHTYRVNKNLVQYSMNLGMRTTGVRRPMYLWTENCSRIEGTWSQFCYPINAQHDIKSRNVRKTWSQHEMSLKKTV